MQGSQILINLNENDKIYFSKKLMRTRNFNSPIIKKISSKNVSQMNPEIKTILIKKRDQPQDNGNKTNIYSSPVKTVKFQDQSQKSTQPIKQIKNKRVNFENKDWYEGTMEGKIPSGQGLYYLFDENLQYQGSFKNGFFDGKGKLVEADVPYKVIYDGQWKQGQKNGRGTYFYSDNGQYTGEWKKNMRDGEGEYVSNAGSYKGSWEKDKKHGKGELILINGTQMKGQWAYDEFIEGSVRYSDGSSYNGKFQRYAREGEGTYEYQNGDKFKGTWKNNQKESRGKFEFRNGDTYEGNFKNNQKHGINSVYRWKDGDQINEAEYDRNELKSGKFQEHTINRRSRYF